MASSSSNETSRQCRNQQTGESCETSAVSSSHTNWELPGAEPQTTHLRQCTEDPPLRRSSSPVSEGLRRDFIARHSIDRGLIESLYTDGRGLPCLDPKRSPDNSLVDGLRSASEAYSERPHFRAMGASSYERLEGAFQHSVAKGATALVERRLQEREEQEQFMREPQREKQMIREERQREEFTRLKRQEQMIREHRERKEWEESMRGLQREEQEVREEREREKREQLKRELQRKEEMIREEIEREEQEEFTRKLQRKERMIREKRERERREKEDREWQEAEKWPPQQEGISIDPQWLCKHYQRHCRVQFPCCKEFYPCHHCHNSSSWCQNDEAKACDATYLKCSFCQLELEIDANSHVCSRCGKKMADYFCGICKNFTSFKNDPFHCNQCGSCRTLKDKSFHCKGCNVCLLKELENNHMCRPNAGYERCFFCREVVFCSPYILLCSHVLHFSCAKALVKSGIHNCQVCHKSLPGTLFE